MKNPEDLLEKLVVYFTKRHVKIVQKYIEEGGTDPEELLKLLGEYSDEDVKITDRWLKNEE